MWNDMILSRKILFSFFFPSRRGERFPNNQPLIVSPAVISGKPHGNVQCSVESNQAGNRRGCSACLSVWRSMHDRPLGLQEGLMMRLGENGLTYSERSTRAVASVVNAAIVGGFGFCCSKEEMVRERERELWRWRGRAEEKAWEPALVGECDAPQYDEGGMFESSYLIRVAPRPAWHRVETALQRVKNRPWKVTSCSSTRLCNGAAQRHFTAPRGCSSCSSTARAQSR